MCLVVCGVNRLFCVFSNKKRIEKKLDRVFFLFFFEKDCLNSRKREALPLPRREFYFNELLPHS